MPAATDQPVRYNWTSRRRDPRRLDEPLPRTSRSWLVPPLRLCRVAGTGRGSVHASGSAKNTEPRQAPHMDSANTGRSAARGRTRPRRGADMVMVKPGSLSRHRPPRERHLCGGRPSLSSVPRVRDDALARPTTAGSKTRRTPPRDDVESRRLQRAGADGNLDLLWSPKRRRSSRRSRKTVVIPGMRSIETRNLGFRVWSCRTLPRNS